MDYAEVLDLQRPIEGMLMEASAALWCILLEAQHLAWEWGEHVDPDYLEIGTFKGKSASILAYFGARYQNNLTVIDPALDSSTKGLLRGICGSTRFIDDRSEMLAGSEFVRLNARKLGFCHIDGMHSFTAVQSDMAMCEPMLSEFGILCLDDFYTELYPQVAAAMYDWLYTTPSDLVPFLVGLNKAYLCRNAAFPYYRKFVEDNLVHSLHTAGHQVTIVKTDSHRKFDAFSIAMWQGEKWFGEHFTK